MAKKKKARGAQPAPVKKKGNKKHASWAEPVEEEEAADELPAAPAAAAPGKKKKRKRAPDQVESQQAVPEQEEKAPPSATSPASLEAWLASGGARGVGDLEVRSYGMAPEVGLFARRAFAAGEVALALPSGLILTPGVATEDEVVAKVARDLKAKGSEDPLLLCSLRLCRARSRPTDRFAPLAASLAEAPEWTPAFRSMLASTSLAPALEAVEADLSRWVSPAAGRESLAWARGAVLRSSKLPCQDGGHTSDKLQFCVIPWFDLLNRTTFPNASVRRGKDGSFEVVCDSEVKAGDQLSLGGRGLGNDELMLNYNFAISDNRFDSVTLSMPGEAGGCTVKLLPAGIPEEVVDKIETEQNTAQFVGLLRATLERRRSVKDCLKRLPQALNFNVCKGPLLRGRKRSLEAFLEGELAILEKCLEEMQAVDPAGNQDETPMAEGEAEEQGEENMDDGEGEEEEDLIIPRFKKRRRRRR